MYDLQERSFTFNKNHAYITLHLGAVYSSLLTFVLTIINKYLYFFLCFQFNILTSHL